MAEYSRGILKIVVAQICQIIGWHSINSTPLEFMVDLMQEYLLRVSRLAHQYAEILGRTDVNLDDVGLAFQQMNIDVHQLAEYVKNVDSLPCVIAVPKLSIFHDNHLNFLKPGSREVVTRSVHVHEHLPAMNLEILSDEVDESSNIENSDTSHDVIESIENQVSSMVSTTSLEVVFKRPCDPQSEHLNTGKKSKLMDESRPLREIHSVMMTTSGFLSPAREGKLPESRTPAQARTDSPPPSSYPMVPPELKCEKKMKKIVKKTVDDRKLDKENKKKNRERELFKPDKIHDPKMKKTGGMKDAVKSKSLKAGGTKPLVIIPSSSTICSPQSHLQTEDLSGKISKKGSPKLRNEKVINAVSSTPSEKRENNFTGKLPAEPDKQKLNIFKKISKPRDDKSSDFPEHHKNKETELYSSSPALICDDAEHKFVRNDIEINLDETKISNAPEDEVFSNAELIGSRSPPTDVYMFDDMSPPGTPSTPKTPELSVPGCVIDQKKKRKEKSIRKKDNVKSLNSRDSAMKGKSTSDQPETDLMSRPKTPDAPDNSIRKDTSVPSALSFPFFPAFPSAPGLIPHPIHHPIFSRFPLPIPRALPNQQLILQNQPLPPRFVSSNSNIDEISLIEEKLPVADSEEVSYLESTPKIDPEKSIKINKIGKQHNMLSPQVLEMSNSRYDIFGSGISSSIHQMSQKMMKPEKNDKKSKKHKIEKKDKIKKKKDKKEKHKAKLEKSKEKKEKLEKILKVKDRKERKDKRKERDKEKKESEAVPKITLKLGTASPTPPTTESNLMKKITIKPLVKKVEDSAKRESSPELAKISALVTRPPKQKPARIKQEAIAKRGDAKDERAPGDRKISETTSTVMDQGGHQVWICPACGNQDDGSPMIGCDDCDAWYHWVCVGMQVPPATNEDWYCRLCIAKKQGLHHDKKKKKRKKKVKVVN